MRSQITAILGGYTRFNYRFFDHATIQGVVIVLGMAGLTGLLAQVRIALPWSPVPVTGQTFAVLLAGALLGRWRGGASMIVYVGCGVLGIPWFTGWAGGFGHLAGPTGGYILGFVLAAFFLGYFTSRYAGARSFLPMLVLMLLANFVLIHGLGLAQLWLWIRLVDGNEATTLANLFWMGTIPFLPGDIAKAIVAAAIASPVVVRRSHNNSVSADRKPIG